MAVRSINELHGIFYYLSFKAVRSITELRSINELHGIFSFFSLKAVRSITKQRSINELRSITEQNPEDFPSTALTLSPIYSFFPFNFNYLKELKSKNICLLVY